MSRPLIENQKQNKILTLRIKCCRKAACWLPRHLTVQLKTNSVCVVTNIYPFPFRWLLSFSSTFIWIFDRSFLFFTHLPKKSCLINPVFLRNSCTGSEKTVNSRDGKSGTKKVLEGNRSWAIGEENLKCFSIFLL